MSSNILQRSHRTYPNTGTTKTKSQNELSSFVLLTSSGFDTIPPCSDLALHLELDLEPYYLHHIIIDVTSSSLVVSHVLK
jgi:hypothetical protein